MYLSVKERVCAFVTAILRTVRTHNLDYASLLIEDEILATKDARMHNRTQTPNAEIPKRHTDLHVDLVCWL